MSFCQLEISVQFEHWLLEERDMDLLVLIWTCLKHFAWNPAQDGGQIYRALWFRTSHIFFWGGGQRTKFVKVCLLIPSKIQLFYLK